MTDRYQELKVQAWLRMWRLIAAHYVTYGPPLASFCGWLR